MGGVQAKEVADVEIHAVRGGQLILRAAPTSSRISSSNSSSSSSLNSAVAGGGVAGGGGGGRERGGSLIRSGPPPLIKRESKLSLIIPGKCHITSQHVDIMEKVLKYLSPR